MQWALVNSENIVESIIVYDGNSPYVPADGFTLREVQDWIKVGLDADLEENQLPQERPADPDPIQEKFKRNATYRQDLSMVAHYDAARTANPQLTFCAYLDSLEQLQSSINIEVDP